MKGVNIAILIAFIAFVIAVVSLGLDFFGVLSTKSSIVSLPNNNLSWMNGLKI